MLRFNKTLARPAIVVWTETDNDKGNRLPALPKLLIMKYQNNNSGESGLLSDKDFFRLLTTDRDGRYVKKDVDTCLKYYPELAQYAEGIVCHH